jgi:DNA-binding response OmpR family regulator
VLLVVDDDDFGGVLEFLLLTAGWEVVRAGSNADAATLVDAADVVIVHVARPLVDAVRAATETLRTRAVVLTTLPANDVPAIEGRQCTVLRIPFDADDLLKCLDTVA